MKKPTGVWYIVPVILGIMGGIIGYVVVKDDDLNIANDLLIIGIIMTFILPIVVWLVLWTWQATYKIPLAGLRMLR